MGGSEENLKTTYEEALKLCAAKRQAEALPILEALYRSAGDDSVPS